MRDVFAAAVALFLLLVAIALMGALHVYRSRRMRMRAAEESRGRTIIAELPSGVDLALVTEDPEAFFFADGRIEKRRIRAVRVLINGAPLAAYVSHRFPDAASAVTPSLEERADGIARDRWDVAIEVDRDTLMIPCGAIRERVSQELARKIYDAVKRAVEEFDRRANVDPAT